MKIGRPESYAMLSLATRDRLAEARFFLDLMEKQPEDSREFAYCFSAFLSASRRVTWIMQWEYAQVEGFDEWYKGEARQFLKQNKLLNNFKELRNISEKRHLIRLTPHITIQLSADRLSSKLVGKKMTLSTQSEVDEEFRHRSVLDLCKTVLGSLTEIVKECEKKFA